MTHEGRMTSDKLVLELHDRIKGLETALAETRAVARETKGTRDLSEANAMLDHIEGIARRVLQ